MNIKETFKHILPCIKLLSFWITVFIIAICLSTVTPAGGNSDTGLEGSSTGSDDAESQGSVETETYNSPDSAGANETPDTTGSKAEEKQETLSQKQSEELQELNDNPNFPVMNPPNTSTDDNAGTGNIIQSDKTKNKKGFFGVEISKNGNTLFLVDVSGSMSSDNTPEHLSRLDILKREMKKVLNNAYKSKSNSGAGTFSKSNLTSGKYLIYSFSDYAARHPAKATRISKLDSSADLNSSITFIDGLNVQGMTAMLSAWQSILPDIKAYKISTVFFLSDGEPTDCDEQGLLNWLHQNVPNIRINTFSVGQPSQLMKNVAQKHKGRYVEIY